MSLLLVDVALSLVIVFVLLSLLCSSLLEWYAQRIGARAQMLRRGLLRMLGDDALYRQVINHPLIETLGRQGRGPSYIPPALLADALIDSIAERAGVIATGKPVLDTGALTIDGLRTHLGSLDRAKFSVAATLAPIVRRSRDLEQVRTEIGRWYEAQTDRVVGWYKDFARRHLFVIGLVVAVVFNVDLIAVTRQVASEPGLRMVLVGYAASPEVLKLAAQAERPQAGPAPDAPAVARQARTLFEKAQGSGLPVGWSGEAFERWSHPWRNRGTLLLWMLGWLLTALGVSLGAPFWFDVLNKLVSLRSSGPKPQAVSATGAPARAT